MIIEENKICVAMRGRDTDETGTTEQRLEPNHTGCVNTLTTVQKDNLVLKKKIKKVGQISNEGSQCGTIVSEDGLVPIENTHNGFYEQAIKTAEENNAEEGDVIDAFNGKVHKDGISPTITTRPEGKKTAILPVVEQYRIRKLTPRECWRLMGYTDADFDKAAAVNSNTQLYKQAGNAIVKQVLMAIFSQLNIKGVEPWNKKVS